MATRTDHGHRHGDGPIGWLLAIFHIGGHGHDHGTMDARDAAFGTREGIRTVWIALAALFVTTVIQVVIVAVSGSVALLADTVHNLGDMLNSVPLLIAFYLARRAATSRYTYGYGRAEDVAGIVIVLSILFSAGYILWESARKLIDPQPIDALPWVAAAAIVGAAGNELVAWFQIRTGRRIGSDALIADGLHARIDGLTSLAVLVAVGGVWLGFPIVDPIVGLLIGVTILFIARDATMRIWYRLMDAIDPSVPARIGSYAGEIRGVERVDATRARWVGHALHAEVELTIADGADAPAVTTATRNLLLRSMPHLEVATIQVRRARPTLAAADAPATSAPARPDRSGILPPRYQDSTAMVSAAPMGAAGLQYDTAGEVAWDEMWGGFCELALAGGAPHRGTLLEPVSEAAVARNPERYAWVQIELEKGLRKVTDLDVIRDPAPGWIGLVCRDEEMALWMLRAIVVENVTIRREDRTLLFPAGPDFRLDGEIRNVITVVAKTNHYWQEHVAGITPAR